MPSEPGDNVPPPADNCAVFVHWGTVDTTVRSTLATVASGLFKSVVVVANDGKERPAALALPSIRWEVPPRNLGFAGGCEYGAALVHARRYAFLNADLTMTPDSLASCLDVLDQPGIGICGPVLHRADGSIQSSCGSLSRICCTPKATGPLSASALCDCDWVTGAALFCRAEVLETVHWDGSYFFAYEDTDFCLRARARGWKVVVVRGATGMHEGGATSRAHPGIVRGFAFYGSRNRIWFVRRHGSPFQSALATLAVIGLGFRIAVADVLKRRKPHLAPYVAGIRAGWGALPSDLEPLEGEPFGRQWSDWGAA